MSTEMNGQSHNGLSKVKKEPRILLEIQADILT